MRFRERRRADAVKRFGAQLSALRAVFFERAETSADSIKKPSAYGRDDSPLATPTRQQQEEAYPLHRECGDEPDPVVPAGVLAHHFEKIPDAVVDAVRPTLISVCCAVVNESRRDDEHSKSSTART